MKSNRKPTIKELHMIDYLIRESSLLELLSQKENLMVRPLNDGGMGSLILLPQNVDDNKRFFGKQISDYLYKDVDDIDVLISLNIDDKGYLFELDIWKINFDPLIEFPKI